jgi:hypothetical protein
LKWRIVETENNLRAEYIGNHAAVRKRDIGFSDRRKGL